MKHKNLKLKISCTQVLDTCHVVARPASAPPGRHSPCVDVGGVMPTRNGIQVVHFKLGTELKADAAPAAARTTPGGSAATVTRRAAARRRAAATALRRASESDSESESESDRWSR